MGSWTLAATLLGYALLTLGGWFGGTNVFVHGMRVLNLAEEPPERAVTPGHPEKSRRRPDAARDLEWIDLVRARERSRADVQRVEEHELHFHFVHAPDGSRIGYDKICKAEEKPVPEEEIVKAFEYEKGEYVYLTDEDFEAAQVEGGRTIDIQAFVPYGEIDPIFFERTYYLAPAEDGEKVYALLARAMKDSGLSAVAKFVMRDRQYLACLRIREGVITLERMHFADEIRDAGELAPKGVRVDKKELAMAAQLVEQFAGKFEPESFQDTYRDTLGKIIEAKRKGEEVHVPEKPEPEAPTDLMAALRASVEAAQQERKRAKGRKRRAKAA